MSTYRRILSPSEIAEVIDALERLAKIYETLGLPEDAMALRGLIHKLTNPQE